MNSNDPQSNAISGMQTLLAFLLTLRSDVSLNQKDLQMLIGNVLDVFANIDTSKILIKIKLHVLVHLPKHIRHRRPAVYFSTEIQ